MGEKMSVTMGETMREMTGKEIREDSSEGKTGETIYGMCSSRQCRQCPFV